MSSHCSLRLESLFRAAPALLALSLGVGYVVACSSDKPAATNDNEPNDGGANTDAGGSDGEPSDGLLVKVHAGEVQGDMVGDVRRFLKIPYAKPPLGDLRWKAPRPAEPWSGVLHETQFSESCAQLADQGAPASNNEDCLYLNLWSPNPAPRKAPVMVWIHGGGNFSGGAGIPIPAVADSLWYDGQFFASQHGVVLVTINYRLGPLGFFAHPDLAKEGEPTGNQGLLDQRLALEWVRDNIAAFGGDPANVTIFGESAGAADVCYHMVSPGSRGLFHRAASESGGCTMRSFGGESAASAVATNMVAYGNAVGCTDVNDQLACLRKASIEDLLANGMQPAPGAGEVQHAKWSFAAVLDGKDGFLPDSPQTLFDQGAIAKVPYLLGSNNDEGTTFVFRAPPLMTEAEYTADLVARYGDKAPDVAALYPPSRFDGDFNAARIRHVGDSGPICSTHDTARRAAKAGIPVYVYNFNVHWSLAPDVLLAGHASEISHVFGAPYAPMPDPASQMVADAMNAYWSHFAETGDPNFSGAPAKWPAFTADADERLELAPGFKVLDDFHAEDCAFWRKYYGAE
jgi:para-nitrobenzyl esterase